MRKSFLIGIMLCLCAVVVPATASGASGTATLTATPSTGLLDGQLISVAASGLKPKASYALVECLAGATNSARCGFFDVEGVTSDATGAFSIPFAAARMITVNGSGSTIDCAVQSCVLAVLAGRRGKVAAQTALSFQDIAVVPPTLSADPSTALRDGQKITLSGTGFDPNSGVEIFECTSEAQTSCDDNVITFVEVNLLGSFSIPFAAARMIDDGESSVDCALTTSCVVVAYGDSPGQTASASIMFADIPIKTPKMTASPSTGLDDGQNVTVTGKGFKHHEEVGLTECVAGSTDGSECVAEAGIGNADEVRADKSGHISATFNVARILTLFGQTIDCAQAPGCVIGAIELDEPTGSVDSVAPISFDPSVPPLPPLNLAVHIDPTGTVISGGAKTDQAQITGTMTCDRTTAVPVEFQALVSEPVGARQASGATVATASCSSVGDPFTVTVTSGTHRTKPFAPGIAGVLMAVSAVSGSSSVDTTISATVTLATPPPSA